MIPGASVIGLYGISTGNCSSFRTLSSYYSYCHTSMAFTERFPEYQQSYGLNAKRQPLCLTFAQLKTAPAPKTCLVPCW
ncbi:hypothetical protein BD777DRAFT_127431 [Yarrowia lipolytica]|nr:hypothetical protein BD777DRAFT_127431 [Yarrowia lipolytica]